MKCVRALVAAHLVLVSCVCAPLAAHLQAWLGRGREGTANAKFGSRVRTQRRRAKSNTCEIYVI